MDKLVKLTVENRTIYNLLLSKLSLFSTKKVSTQELHTGKSMAFLYNKFI